MSKISIRIAEADDFPSDTLARLQSMAAVDVRPVTQDGLSDALAAHDVLWLRLGLRVRASDVPAAPRCRWIVTATTGEDHIEEAALRKMNATLLSLKGRREFLDTITSTAEHTLGLCWPWLGIRFRQQSRSETETGTVMPSRGPNCRERWRWLWAMDVWAAWWPPTCVRYGSACWPLIPM